jgi:hypothetical protein
MIGSILFAFSRTSAALGQSAAQQLDPLNGHGQRAVFRLPRVGNLIIEIDLVGRRFRSTAMAEQVLLDRCHADLTSRNLSGKPIRQGLQCTQAQTTALVEPREIPGNNLILIRDLGCP